ncbi:pyruvate formate lyase family protein [Thermoanaerobacterium thermosaccharolyticum]|uniref:pyruvate formate lyase family protein n=1 Tax=Thermoanaerobacterium thermosaccharolyticum TaxID=1517 RepID=UPI003D2B28BF
MINEWRGFQEGKWQKNIDVQDFIQRNYTLYEGDDSFLEGPTEKTTKLWNKVLELMREELEKGVLDIDTKTVSSITSHEAGYIDKDLEEIVGLQTDKPLKRAIMPYGGIRMVKKACEAYGYKVDPAVEEIFTKYRKTHNDGVFDAYTPEIRAARHAGIITGLPDAYGRGRIIGDYRRVALYGIDRLIEEKEKEKLELDYMNLMKLQ